MGRPKSENRKPINKVGLSLRCSDAWLAWLDDVRSEMGPGVSRAQAVDRLLASGARMERMKTPPKRNP